MRTRARRALSAGRKLAVKAAAGARGHGRTLLSDLFVLAGGLMAVHGLFLVWRPVGFLAVGGLLAGVGLVLVPAAKKRGQQ